MDRDKVTRHDEPVPVEKPTCPVCGQDLDSQGVCMDRCATKGDETPVERPNVRHG